jgi:hypothetical protein
MKLIIKLAACFLLTGTMVFVSCKKEKPASAVVTLPASAFLNHPPVANAGADQTITLPTSTVNLDGSGSTDPDNNITGYVWTKISGPSSFNIKNANDVQTQAINLVEGVYQFEFKVTDAGGLLSWDTIMVNVVTCIGPTDPTELLIMASWKMVSATSQFPVDWDGDGIASTDLYAQMPPCYKDDIYTFYNTLTGWSTNTRWLWVTENSCCYADDCGAWDGFGWKWIDPGRIIKMGVVDFSGVDPGLDTVEILSSCKFRFTGPLFVKNYNSSYLINATYTFSH